MSYVLTFGPGRQRGARHYVAHSPCEEMQTIERPSRNRVLTDNELAAVFSAAKKFGYPFGTIVQICILTGQLTGQRRSEIAWLRRSYFAETAFDEVCPINPWTLHDLRRTLAHQWQGFKIERTQAALNHIRNARRRCRRLSDL